MSLDLGKVDTFIKAARQHGLDSGPDHEVGDLQHMLHVAWNILTPQQRISFAADYYVLNILEMGFPTEFDAIWDNKQKT